MASALAPDELGPTVCVGEILVEIVATTTGAGFYSDVDSKGMLCSSNVKRRLFQQKVKASPKK